MTGTIVADVGKAHNLPELKLLHREYIEVCIIQGRGMQAAAGILNISYKHLIRIRQELYDTFNVKYEPSLALALVNNGVIELK